VFGDPDTVASILLTLGVAACAVPLNVVFGVAAAGWLGAVGRGFVRAGGRAGVVAPDGSVALAAERVCSAPVAVLPAGERRMLVACRDGTLVMLEE